VNFGDEVSLRRVDCNTPDLLLFNWRKLNNELDLIIFKCHLKVVILQVDNKQLG